MKKEEYHLSAEEQKTDQYIRKKLMEAADAYEQELNADASLDDIRLTDKMRADMMELIAQEDARRAEEDTVVAETIMENSAAEETAAGIVTEPIVHFAAKGIAFSEEETDNELLKAEVSAEALLGEEDRAALAFGRKAMRIARYRKALQAAGLVLVLGLGIFGVSMTSKANRLWFVNAWNMLWGKEHVLQFENRDDEIFDDFEMEAVYADILEQTGIHSVEFMYRPEELVFNNYSTSTDVGVAVLSYQYNETILTIWMMRDSNQSSKAQIFDGEVLETMEIETYNGEIVTIMEIAGPEELDYVGEIVYDNCLYSIYGILPREEFIEIAKNINFY